MEQSIIIDENIEITIIGIADGKVKLGINAPKNVEVVRKEIKDAVKNENKEAMEGLDLNALKKMLKK